MVQQVIARSLTRFFNSKNKPLQITGAYFSLLLKD